MTTGVPPDGYEIPWDAKGHYLDFSERGESDIALLIELRDGAVVTFDDWADMPVDFYCAHSVFCPYCGRRLNHAHG